MYTIPKNSPVLSLPFKSYSGKHSGYQEPSCETMRAKAGWLPWLLWVSTSSLLKESKVGLPALQGAVNVCDPDCRVLWMSWPPRLLPKHRPLPAHHALPVWWTKTCSQDNSNPTLTAGWTREVATLPLGTQDTLSVSWPAPHLPAQQFHG